MLFVSQHIAGPQNEEQFVSAATMYCVAEWNLMKIYDLLVATSLWMFVPSREVDNGVAGIAEWVYVK